MSTHTVEVKFVHKGKDAVVMYDDEGDEKLGIVVESLDIAKVLGMEMFKDDGGGNAKGVVRSDRLLKRHVDVRRRMSAFCNWLDGFLPFEMDELRESWREFTRYEAAHLFVLYAEWNHGVDFGEYWLSEGYWEEDFPSQCSENHPCTCARAPATPQGTGTRPAG